MPATALRMGDVPEAGRLLWETGKSMVGGRIMPRTFKAGDHVEWNSEAGRVQGIIKEKVVSEITFKGYTVHASEKEPQYLIESEKTGHLAMHKGTALRKIARGRS
jgi:hypothetical protein